MKDLALAHPGIETIKGWNNEAMESFGEGDWIGRLDSSLELHLLSGTTHLDAQSFNRFEPLLDNLRLVGCFKDISMNDVIMEESKEEFYHKIDKINSVYADSFKWDMPTYLNRVYDEAYDQDISVEFFSEEVEVDNLSYNAALVEKIDELMRGDENFSVKGVDMNSFAEGDDLEQVYQNIEKDLYFTVDFSYAGDQALLREYNQITSRWGDETEYAGIPGIIEIGKGRPQARFLDGGELTHEASRVNGWLYETFQDMNLGANSRVKREKLEG